MLIIAPRPPWKVGRRIMELEPPAVVLDDLLDDSEAEAGALLARRHIGLEQPLPVLARQTPAIVDDIDTNLSARFVERTRIAPVSPISLTIASIASAAFLMTIAERLRSEGGCRTCPSAARCRTRARTCMSDRLTSTRNDASRMRLAHVDELHLRFRHAREGGEFIDHAPDVARPDG
jgi:hypothetical protein